MKWHMQETVRSSVISSLILLCVLLLHPVVTDGQAQSRKPITKENLLSALNSCKERKDCSPCKKGGPCRLGAPDFIRRIKQLKVDFQLTELDEQEIRQAGAFLDEAGLKELIIAVRANYVGGPGDNGRQISRAHELLENSSEFLKNSPEWFNRGLLLALESYRINPTAQAYHLIHEAIKILPKNRMSLKQDDMVDILRFSDDGQYILTVGTNNTVRLWQVASGREFYKIEHSARINDAALSRYMLNLVTASADRKIRIFDARSGRKYAEIPTADEVHRLLIDPYSGYIAAVGTGVSARTVSILNRNREVARVTHDEGEAISAIAFTPNGRYLATGIRGKGFNYTVRLWEVPSGKEVLRLPIVGSATDVEFSPNGLYLATGSNFGSVRVWMVASDQGVSESANEVSKAELKSVVNDVSFSPDGQYIATAGEDGKGRILNVWNGAELSQVQHEGKIHLITFSPDANHVASVSRSKAEKYPRDTVRVWRTYGAREVARMALEFPVKGIAFNHDGKYLATASNEIVDVWEPFTPALEVANLPDKSSWGEYTYSSNGRYLTATIGDRTLRIWDLVAMQEMTRIPFDGVPRVLTISDDGKYVALALAPEFTGLTIKDFSRRTTISVWDTTSRKEILIRELEPEGHPEGPIFVDFSLSPNGKYLALRFFDTSTLVIDTNTHQEFKLPTIQLNGGRSIAFSPDGRYLALAVDGDARVWDLSNNLEIARIPHKGVAIGSLSFSPDGELLAVGSFDGSVRVFKWRNPEAREVASVRHEVAPLSELPESVFSSDSKFLLTISKKKIARIWEVETGTEIARISKTETETWSRYYEIDTSSLAIFFRADGKLCIFDGNLMRIQKWRPESVVDEACTRLTRNLSLGEWQWYLPGEAYRRTCPNLP